MRKGTYLHVTLYKNNERRKMDVHRLVALMLVPNPDNKPEVNHIDGNPFNNNVDNLEWCTRSENEMHKRFLQLTEAFENDFRRRQSI